MKMRLEFRLQAGGLIQPPEGGTPNDFPQEKAKKSRRHEHFSAKATPS
jgi:hypothetical protein